jgi:hypothetical protein
MITAMLAVMVAMTGLAAASPFNGELWTQDGSAIAPASNIPITQGETLHYSYKASGVYYNALEGSYSLPYFVTITPLGTGVMGDITVWTDPAGLLVNANPAMNLDDVTITLNTYRAGAAYFVEIKAAGATTSALTLESGQASRTWESQIPEFPSVALPVGAAIGLMFLFQTRRNKKE